MPTCKVCQLPKLDDQFPVYSAKGASGRRGTCLPCWNAKWSPVKNEHNSRYYNENTNGYGDMQRRRAARQYELNPSDQFLRNKRYSERHPERHAAKTAVMIAVRSEKLKRVPCMICGQKADAHHEDYSKPLEVLWLCRTHHGERHRQINRESDR